MKLFAIYILSLLSIVCINMQLFGSALAEEIEITTIGLSKSTLKQYRAIATRYDKTAQNFLGAIYLAATVIWLN